MLNRFVILLRLKLKKVFDVVVDVLVETGVVVGVCGVVFGILQQTLPNPHILYDLEISEQEISN